MALVLREFLNAKVNSSMNIKNPLDLKENFNSNSAIGQPDMVIAEIEGLHNIVTGNNTLYTESALISSIPSWTYPYEKAVILHHDEDDGEVIGRVKSVSVGDSEVIKGFKSLNFVTSILEDKNQQATLDGRNKTVSVGVIANDVTCSICGKQLAGGEFCEHERGNVYNGELCYWSIHDMQAKELSFVNVPSDQYAQVTKAYKLKDANKGVNTSMSKSLEEKQELGNKKEDDKEKDLIKKSQEEIIKELNEEKKELKKEIEEKEKELNSINDNLDDFKKQLDGLKDSLIKKDEEVKKEKELRESLEGELEKYQDSIKDNLLKEISGLREKLNLETEINNFKERSIDSLKDSIVDLKEQLSHNPNQIGKVFKEGLVNEDEEKQIIEKQNKEKEVKKQNALNLNEKLNEIFK